ncbi:hypothetical protein ATL39_1793 [Sinobaca qinghaiensis]|uniref:Uncharacterized protein n=1 Tax=Sinobaca qinghaiensis TaxID=342944 RepID=A0A419V4P9_9BACL|nr:hypothetical protein ATL39_1793 [Sinobaca qinghaiensis]
MIFKIEKQYLKVKKTAGFSIRGGRLFRLFSSVFCEIRDVYILDNKKENQKEEDKNKCIQKPVYI